MLSFTLSLAERDAIYELALDHLSGFDDLRLAIGRGDLDTAQRLSLEFSDEQRLILYDLDWGDDVERAAFRLTLPPEELRRLFASLRQRVEVQIATEAQDETDAEHYRRRSALVKGACDRVLGILDAELADPGRVRGGPSIERHDVREILRDGWPPATPHWWADNRFDEDAMQMAIDACAAEPTKAAAARAGIQFGFTAHQRLEGQRARRRGGPRYGVRYVAVDLDSNAPLYEPFGSREFVEELVGMANESEQAQAEEAGA